MNTPLSPNFLRTFLNNRNLSSPSGEPLYSYKVKTEEYEKLKYLLSIARTNERLEGWFFLYATEWWRRNYAGGHWEWEPIFRGISRPEWNTVAQRQRLMQQGSDFWGREIFRHQDGSNDYLGTLFFESGIPIRLLTSQTKLQSLVLRSFEQLQSYHYEDPLPIIEQIANGLYLPEALKVKPFYAMIVKVVQELLHLKRQYGLGQKLEPLAVLNQEAPAWRDRLPLWLDEDTNAKAFLDSLLVEAVKIKRREPLKVTANYELIIVNGEWRVKTNLEIPNGCHKPEALSIEPAVFASFSSKIAIKVVSDLDEIDLGYGYKNSRDELSVSNLAVKKLPANLYATPWQLVFEDSYTEKQVAVTLPFCDGLPVEMPWYFIQKGDNWVLKGIGSVRLKTDQARIICPKQTKIKSDGEEAVYLGEFSGNQVVYEIRSSCLLQDIEDDQLFSLRLAETTEDEFVYDLLPQDAATCLQFYQRQNASAYVGFPRIFQVHQSGQWRTPVTSHQLQIKTANVTNWQPLINADTLTGRFKIRCIGSGQEVLFTKQISVLPPSFKLSYSTNPLGVRLSGTVVFSLQVNNEPGTEKVEISRCEGGHFIGVPASYQTDRIRIRLNRPDFLPIDLWIPCPGYVAYFTNKYNEVIARDEVIDLQRLHGTSLVLNNLHSTEQTREISLRLNDYHTTKELTQTEIRRVIPQAPSCTQAISLQRFRNEIERLLSFTNSVDAAVRIHLPEGRRISIKQYTHPTQFDPQTRTVQLPGAAVDRSSIQIQSFPLSKEFSPDKIITLTPAEEGWKFPEQTDFNGKWFFYSSPDSAAQIRPSVALVDKVEEDLSDSVSNLHEASNHSFQNRQVVLKNLFDRIASDFTDANWTILKQLFECTQHLTFNALDYWKALAKSNRGLVSFFLQYDSATIERFTREFSINWCLIPVQDWREIVEAYYTYWQTILPAYAQQLTEGKFVELEAGLQLGSLAQRLRKEVFHQPVSQEFKVFGVSAFVSSLMKEEILGQQGRPGLVTRHGVQNYPSYAGLELETEYRRLPEGLRNLLPPIPPHFNYVRSLVQLPLVLAYYSMYSHSGSLKTFDRFRIMQLIEFDKDHFYLFFNLVQSYCWLSSIR